MASQSNSGSDLAFEAEPFKAGAKLLGSLEPPEYKHVTLDLIFLKYTSEAFEHDCAKLMPEEFADPEDPKGYLASNVFWVPSEAWREHLGEYQDVPGFRKSAALEEARKHGHILKLGCHVEAEDAEDDGVPFAEGFAALTATMEDQFNDSDWLTALIRKRLAMVEVPNVS